MNITEIEEVIKRGQELNRAYFAYGTDEEITIVKTCDIDKVSKEIFVSMEDKEKPLTVDKFFYFDYVEFTGQGGVF